MDKFVVNHVRGKMCLPLDVDLQDMDWDELPTSQSGTNKGDREIMGYSIKLNRDEVINGLQYHAGDKLNIADPTNADEKQQLDALLKEAGMKAEHRSTVRNPRRSRA